MTWGPLDRTQGLPIAILAFVNQFVPPTAAGTRPVPRPTHLGTPDRVRGSASGLGRRQGGEATGRRHIRCAPQSPHQRPRAPAPRELEALLTLGNLLKFEKPHPPSVAINHKQRPLNPSQPAPGLIAKQVHHNQHNSWSRVFILNLWSGEWSEQLDTCCDRCDQKNQASNLVCTQLYKNSPIHSCFGLCIIFHKSKRKGRQIYWWQKGRYFLIHTQPLGRVQLCPRF